MVAKQKAEAIEAITCPFCHAPWTEAMMRVYDISSYGGCDTCGHGSTGHATLDITCEKCERLIYRKEYRT